GYLEIDAYSGTKSQIDANGFLTQGQSFILTGTLGSRQFNFSEGAQISDIVSAIKNVAGSTGVDASLIFNRSQAVNVANSAAVSSSLGTAGTADACYISIYDNYSIGTDGTKTLIATAASFGNAVFGKNTDGNGNIYIKFLANNSYEAYKDASLSKESLIASGVGSAGAASEQNNSGATDLSVTVGNAKYGDVIRLSVGNIQLGDDSAYVSGSAACLFKLANSTAAGVQLGINTDAAGKIYLKVVYDSGSNSSGKVYAYNNALMREQDKVAETMAAVALGGGSGSIILDSIWSDEHTANTGLGLTLANGTFNNTAPGVTKTMELQFTNLGARISTAEYGSDQYIRVQTFEGGLFVDYEDSADYNSAKLLERNTTYERRGQDATITVNGQQMKTSGLTLDLATPDIMAGIIFNAGKSGTTTIAQVGYNEGTVFTKATSLTATSDTTGLFGITGLLNNAGHVTTETIGNFQSGMQLQLGEGSGDQERTVISLKSMATAQLGRLEVTKQFDSKKAVIETKTLSIQDVMGGQLASLSVDPSLTMRIIEKAISDVSEQRASIGAVQANMLQTNENNLRVAIENITKTESNIRDTDMAAEMTEFVKNQVLSNAGLSMVTQANNQAQQVIALLQ
ncbi:MAG: hypothetical protein LBU23_00890, partial [Planctomycetota bacterium]|nr:hypothetical protein [Planctomycetota bacterium]